MAATLRQIEENGALLQFPPAAECEGEHKRGPFMRGREKKSNAASRSVKLRIQ